jgi:hypothetical protein
MIRIRPGPGRAARVGPNGGGSIDGNLGQGRGSDAMVGGWG